MAGREDRLDAHERRIAATARQIEEADALVARWRTEAERAQDDGYRAHAQHRAKEAAGEATRLRRLLARLRASNA